MIEKLIYESKKSKIYFQDQSEWGCPVVLKILNYEFPTPGEIFQFYNEFEIIKGLNLPGIRKVLGKKKINNKHAIFLEWVDAQPVTEVFRNNKGNIVLFLQVAIEIAQALGELHLNHIIHKDITPFNILINPEKRTVKIIDFGISTKINLKQHHLGNPERLDGTLAYNSPEQTGRMNRLVDYRTDIYSMGVMFYEMLSGKLPFDTKDALELVHNHLAVMPPPINELVESLPEAMVDIIGILLAKNADDRYQSAFGVKNDLEHCLFEYETKGKITNFRLKQRDYSGKFQIPQKLFGRENEIAKLISNFDRCAKGKLGMLLVTGYSGTGKSALIHEVHKPITQKRGYFIEGKFDQFQRAVPYYAFIQAFSEFINFLLTDSEDILVRYRNDIQKAVGAEGKVLTDVIPNLHHVIGKQPEVPELGASEAQNRFNYVIGKFVSAISKPEHPIVLFIDDLQWSDNASLSLLKVLMSDVDNGYLLFIGAYRDNEVTNSHPLIITINELKESYAEIDSIRLGNLSLSMVNQLVEETISSEREKAYALTDLLYKKTEGNAFFVTEFLKSLYEEELLQFNFTSNQWNWNLKRIEEKNITDNVVSLLAGKILKLPEATQKALKLAACIGFGFDPSILSIIYEQDTEQTRRDLDPAMIEGLLITTGDQLRFSHDRIQQAVYTLIPDEEKNAVHYSIGKLFLNKLNEQEKEVHLFDITNQLNHGITLITEEKEKDLLAGLNYKAGIKAKQTYAFSQAIYYLQTGISLLKTDHWHSQHKLSKGLFIAAAESSYLNSDFNSMDSYLNELLNPNIKILDQVEAYEILIQALIAQNKLQEALEAGLSILKKLDIDFPSHPGDLHIILGLINTKLTLLGKSFETLEYLPTLNDDMDLARMRLCTEITPPAYWVNPKILLLAVFKVIQLTIKRGASLQSIYAFGTYGMVMCELGDVELGRKFGGLTYRLLENPGAKAVSCRSIFLVQCFINHWTEPLRNSIKPFLNNYQLGLETGDLDFAALSYYFYCQHGYYSGKKLLGLAEEMEAAIMTLDRLRQNTPNNYLKIHYQAVLNFLQPTEEPHLLKGEVYSSDEMLQIHTIANDRTAMYKCHFQQMVLGYFFEAYPSALANADLANKLLDGVTAQHVKALYNFYEALICLSLYESANTAEKRKLMKRVRISQKKIKKFAAYSPENFLHKYDLIEAERLRVSNDHSEARIYFDKAIHGAKKNNFTHEKALAYELTGKYYLHQQSFELAAFYLTGAHNSYREWGAQAKADNLEVKYKRHIITENRTETDFGLTNSLTRTTHSKVLDFASVLKASKTISSEIVLTNLLQKLMEITIENAGAQSGMLLLESEGKLFIEVRTLTGLNETSMKEHIDVSGCGLLVESIVKYVKRTSECVVVNEAVNDHRFENDPFVLEKKPKSILAIPINSQGKLIGILYLENNLTSYTFTNERIELLTILTGQIAVSIENAILYDQLEQKVLERTNQLANEKKKSDTLLNNILPSEIAEELKREGKIVPRRYQNVTVMFTDFQGFTKHAQNMTPDELVKEVDECFSAFDEIISRYGIEKIKTIGDAYMCVGGLPIPNETHASDTVKAAKEIQRWMQERKEYCKKQNRPCWEIRIGLHTGPVVAGVVGFQKFAYDIWGDTVNTASRIESSGEAGKVNISGDTFERIKEMFNCTYRGKIAAKNKGEIDMYFVEDILYAQDLII